MRFCALVTWLRSAICYLVNGCLNWKPSESTDPPTCLDAVTPGGIGMSGTEVGAGMCAGTDMGAGAEAGAGMDAGTAMGSDTGADAGTGLSIGLECFRSLCLFRSLYLEHPTEHSVQKYFFGILSLRVLMHK